MLWKMKDVYTAMIPAQIQTWINGIEVNVGQLFNFINTSHFSAQSVDNFFYLVKDDLAYQTFLVFQNQVKTLLRTPFHTTVDPQVFRRHLLSQQAPHKRNITSPFFYCEQLTKLEQKITKDETIPKVFADIFREARVKFSEQLKSNTKLTLTYLYEELVNHVIEHAGKQITTERLLTVMKFYEDILDKESYQEISKAVLFFCATANQTKLDIYDHVPTHSYRKLIKNLNDFYLDTKIHPTQVTQAPRFSELLSVTWQTLQQNKHSLLTTGAVLLAGGLITYMATTTNPTYENPLNWHKSLSTFTHLGLGYASLKLSGIPTTTPIVLAGMIQGLTTLPSFTMARAFGDEFKVNTNTASNQVTPAVTSLSTGEFVVVWDGDQTGTSDIYGQRINATGNFIGNEFRVNTNTANDQTKPAISSLTTGDFVVVWQGSQTGNDDIYGQRFDATCTPLGTEFRVNTYLTNPQVNADVASLTQGNFIVVWNGIDDFSLGSDIFGQRFNNTGGKTGTEFKVNTYLQNNQASPAALGLNNDDFVVVWSGAGQGDTVGVYGQRFSGVGGSLGSGFRVNTNTTLNQQNVAITSLPNDNFLVIWNGEQTGVGSGKTYGQRFTNQGAPLQTELLVANGLYYPAITTLINGDIEVVGNDAGPGETVGVFGQHCNSQGVQLGPEYQVNMYTTGNQYFPSIASINNGYFLVVWYGAGQTDTNGIFGRIIDPGIVITTGTTETIATTGTTAQMGGTTGVANITTNSLATTGSNPILSTSFISSSTANTNAATTTAITSTQAGSSSGNSQVSTSNGVSSSSGQNLTSATTAAMNNPTTSSSGTSLSPTTTTSSASVFVSQGTSLTPPIIAVTQVFTCLYLGLTSQTNAFFATAMNQNFTPFNIGIGEALGTLTFTVCVGGITYAVINCNANNEEQSISVEMNEPVIQDNSPKAYTTKAARYSLFPPPQQATTSPYASDKRFAASPDASHHHVVEESTTQNNAL